MTGPSRTRSVEPSVVPTWRCRVQPLSIEQIEDCPAATATAWRGRMTLVFAVIVATSVSAFFLSLVSYVRPIAKSDFPTFAELSHHRSYVWAFFLVAGIQLVVGVCGAAIAGLV